MAGDLLVFLRGEDLYLDTLCGIVGGIVSGSAPAFIEVDAAPRQTIADRSAYFAIVFSNSACEDDKVDATERSDHCHDLFSHGIAEHLDGKPRIGVRRSHVMKAPHVAADAGNAQQAGTVIDQRLDPVCVEFLLTHQIDQDAWIKIATARAHDHPAAWGQSHAGIDRFTPLTAVTLAPLPRWAMIKRSGKSPAS